MLEKPSVIAFTSSVILNIRPRKKTAIFSVSTSANECLSDFGLSFPFMSHVIIHLKSASPLISVSQEGGKTDDKMFEYLLKQFFCLLFIVTMHRNQYLWLKRHSNDFLFFFSFSHGTNHDSVIRKKAIIHHFFMEEPRVSFDSWWNLFKVEFEGELWKKKVFSMIFLLGRNVLICG